MRAYLLPAALLLSFSAAAQQPAQSKPSLAQPALAPDGKNIAFVEGGDIWEAPASGGQAHLLISNPAEESRPLYSPDGQRLAFQSTRTGAADIYVLTLATGTLQRITYTDAPVSLDAWSPDGQWLYFTSSANDVAGQGDIFRVHSTGGTPLEVSADRYLNEFESSPTADGKAIVLAAKGISSSQWWRNGHAHIDEAELWYRPLDGSAPRRLAGTEAKHAWPMASANGKSLYFMSDRSSSGQPGSENIWEADLATGGAAVQLTQFRSGRCLWPTLSYDGKTIVFERNFAIWKVDTKGGHAAQIDIELRGAPSGPGVTHTSINAWSDLALAPDGKKLALAAHGEIFAAGAKEGGEAQRLTTTDAAESAPVWSPDSTKVLYASERDGGSSLYEYDLTSSTERALTKSAAIDNAATWSPDGKSIAFIRNSKELHVLTLAGMTDKVVARGELDADGEGQVAWSPDSHWVVYVPLGIDDFSNLYAVPADGSKPAQPLTFLANGQNASRIAWSPDGKYILFDTSQRAETPRLARVDLIPHVPSFREDQFRDLFKKQSTPGAPETAPSNRPDTLPATETKSDKSAEPASTDLKADAKKPDADTRPKKKPEPTRIVFEGIRNRLTLLPIDLDLRNPLISPDGKTLAFTAEVSGQGNIYTYSLDELAKEPATPKQLTSTPGFKGDLAFSPDSKDLFYLEGGENGAGVRTISIDSKVAKPIQVSAAIDVDFDHEKMVVFDEAWTTLDHRFWEPHFNGANWPALREQWRPYIAGARTGPELRRDINLLIGELNSSHSGINRASPPAVRTGRLGLRFERAPYEANGALIIRELVPLGPADLEGSLHVGDRLLGINGHAIDAATNLDQLLEDAAGKRVVLSIATSGDLTKKRDAIVRPISLQVESGLLYRGWVEGRRAYVDKISGGKLGYVHIAAMGDSDLAQVYLDLDAQNQSKRGVVVDVRNNNGGYVNGRVIDIFARKNYLIMTPRDGSPAPSRQALGQRALGLPTALLINESTLSDGEDFTEGYRTLHLGKVIGVPTAGWIVFTGSRRLIDGSAVRVPGYRIDDTRGQNMEMHPRPVDVEQERALGEPEDAQLKRAVETLLSEIK